MNDIHKLGYRADLERAGGMVRVVAILHGPPTDVVTIWEGEDTPEARPKYQNALHLAEAYAFYLNCGGNHAEIGALMCAFAQLPDFKIDGCTLVAVSCEADREVYWKKDDDGTYLHVAPDVGAEVLAPGQLQARLEDDRARHEARLREEEDPWAFFDEPGPGEEDDDDDDDGPAGDRPALGSDL